MNNFLSNDSFIFYFIFIICGILIFIPIIGKYIRLIETMIHEFGHVIISVILGCPIKRVNLFSNTSGETIVSASKSKTFFIAFAGYPFSAAISWVCFWANAHHHQDYLLYALTILSILFLILYIRNPFGIFWTLSLIIMNSFIIYIDNAITIKILANIYACIIFIESNLSVFRLVILSLRNGVQAGDAGILYKLTHIHAIFYALLFLSINIFISYYTIIYFFPLKFI